MIFPEQRISRDYAIDEATLRLLTGATSSAHLREIRMLLAPVAADRNEPAWIRDALTTTLRLLEHAEGGAADADSALQRVIALLELVSTGGPEEPGSAASRVSCALPIESARDLLPQFIEESLDGLEQAEQALLELESNPAAIDAVNVIFRAFHTIKGTSAFFGLDAVSTLAHEIESVLCEVRDGRAEFTRATANLALACADMMRALVRGLDALVAGQDLEVPPGYVALLEQVKAASHTAAGPSRHVQAPAAPEQANATRRAESWLRVRTERLDQLLDLVGELVVAHSMIAADQLIQQERHGVLARKVQQTSKIVRELQTLSLSLRMVPLKPLFQKIQRLARDLAQSTGKQMQLITVGEETEVDRGMVEALADPLVHMIRNAIDHGIEGAAERIEAGKPATGTIHMSAEQVGGSVIIELRDDGRGLDTARILASAADRGIVERERNLTPTEIQQLIFQPGLSTCADVTELSGRGVGMDVVRRNIELLHGSVEIASTSGAGTTFTIRFPLTRAITDGMLVRVGSERYILPTAEIQTSFRPKPDNLVLAGGDGELAMLHGHALPVVRLHHVLGIDSAVTDPTEALLVVLGQNERRFALLVDDLLGQHQFVAKPVRGGMKPVAGIAGGAILGDGRVGLILDPGGLLEAARGMRSFH